MPSFLATYRLQLTPDFGFAAAVRAVPYLQALGISHLYLSPSLQARPGSTHGYDVVDPTRISRDLGGEERFRRLAATAHDAGMGIVLDIVPNHMAADDANPWWADETTRAEVFDYDPETGWYRRFFDVDGLAGVRQEDPAVFERTHAKVFELLDAGLVDGLRIDHPDGLADPAGYLERLRAGARATCGSRRSSTTARPSGRGRSRGRPATSSWSTSPPPSSTLRARGRSRRPTRS